MASLKLKMHKDQPLSPGPLLRMACLKQGITTLTQPEPEPYRSAFKLHQTISGSGDKKNDVPLPAKPKNWEKIEEKRRRCNDKVNQAFDDCREKKLNDPKMKEFEKKADAVMKKYEEKEKLNGGSLKPDDYRRRHNEIQALRYQYSDALRSCEENERIERKRCAEEYKREIE
jgi:hypothetical protein